jgi:hypothetical protein
MMADYSVLEMVALMDYLMGHPKENQSVGLKVETKVVSTEHEMVGLMAVCTVGLMEYHEELN